MAEHAFSGDVICDRKDFIFSVEAKSQKAFSFVAILKSPKTAKFTEWWRQCTEDAEKVSKLPMLMFKPDAQEDFVAITHEGVEKLGILTAPHFSIVDAYEDLPVPKIFRWKTLVSSEAFRGTVASNMFGD